MKWVMKIEKIMMLCFLVIIQYCQSEHETQVRIPHTGGEFDGYCYDQGWYRDNGIIYPYNDYRHHTESRCYYNNQNCNSNYETAYDYTITGCLCCPASPGFWSYDYLTVNSCLAGTYSDGYARTRCTNCVAGKYQPYDMRTACYDCPVGKYARYSGSSVCEDCTPGYTTVSTGSTQEQDCNTCADGYYLTSTEIGDQCQACPSGTYGIGGECQECAPGEFLSPQTGLCTICAPGKYSDTSGSIACTKCAAGKYSNYESCWAYVESRIDTLPPSQHCSNGESNCWHAVCRDDIEDCVPCAENEKCEDGGCSFCSKCDAGQYPNEQKDGCLSCAVGKYSDPFNTLGMCTPCDANTVCENGACGECIECEPGKKDANEARKLCVSCDEEDGYFVDDNKIEGEGCGSCVNGKFMDMRRVEELGREEACTDCPTGKYSITRGATSCELCPACPDQHYRVGCDTIGSFGECVPCDPTRCDDGEVLVDCINRAGHNDARGDCVRAEYVSSTPVCREYAGYGFVSVGMGGFDFQTVFGADENHTDFQCSRACDGRAGFMPSDYDSGEGKYALNETSLLTNLTQRIDGELYRGQMDTRYCTGPRACNAVSCSAKINSENALAESYREPWGCPLYIEDGDSDSVIREKMSASCQKCEECGQSNIATADDYGRGCAVECSHVFGCDVDYIFDWTEPNPLLKCKRCSELRDVRLCATSHYADNNLGNTDVSGNRPKLDFQNCKGVSPVNEKSTPTYGKCVLKEDVQCEGDNVYDDGSGNCVACEPHGSMKLMTTDYYDMTNDLSLKKLYCQISACTSVEDVSYTGVQDNGELCGQACATVECPVGSVNVPCVLPHLRNRCVVGRSLVDSGARVAREHMPAYTNMFEGVDEVEAYHYASFENLLINLEGLEEDLHQCVWNVIDIRDNDMNPGGIAHSFFKPASDYGFLESRGSKFCNAWARDSKIEYPLLPLQNAVTLPVMATHEPRHVYVNTSARVMQFWNDSPDNVGERGYNGIGFDSASEDERVAHMQTISRPSSFFGHISTDLDLFLNLDMRQANHSVISLLVPQDRNLKNVTWVPQWSLSVYVRESTSPVLDVDLFTVRLAFDVDMTLTRLVTKDSYLQLVLDEKLLPPFQLLNFNHQPLQLTSLTTATIFSQLTRFSWNASNVNFVHNDNAITVYVRTTPVPSSTRSLRFGDYAHLYEMGAIRTHKRDADVVFENSIDTDSSKTLTDMQVHSESAEVASFSTLYAVQGVFVNLNLNATNTTDSWNVHTQSLYSVQVPEVIRTYAYMSPNLLLIAVLNRNTGQTEVRAFDTDSKQVQPSYTYQPSFTVLRMRTAPTASRLWVMLLEEGLEQKRVLVQELQERCITESENCTRRLQSGSNTTFSFTPLPNEVTVLDYSEAFDIDSVELGITSLLTVQVDFLHVLAVLPLKRILANGEHEYLLRVKMWGSHSTEAKALDYTLASDSAFSSALKSYMSHAWLDVSAHQGRVVLGYLGHLYVLVFSPTSMHVQKLEFSWLANTHFGTFQKSFLVFDLRPYLDTTSSFSSCGSGFYLQSIFTSQVFTPSNVTKAMCKESCFAKNTCKGFVFDGVCKQYTGKNLFQNEEDAAVLVIANDVCRKIELATQDYTPLLNVPVYQSLRVGGVLTDVVELDSSANASEIGYAVFCVQPGCSIAHKVLYELMPVVSVDGVLRAFESPTDEWLWKHWKRQGQDTIRTLAHVQLFEKAWDANNVSLNLSSAKLKVLVSNLAQFSTMLVSLENSSLTSPIICSLQTSNSSVSGSLLLFQKQDETSLLWVSILKHSRDIVSESHNCTALYLPHSARVLSFQNMDDMLSSGIAFNLVRTWANRSMHYDYNNYDYWRADALPHDKWLYMQRFLPGRLLKTVLSNLTSAAPAPIYLHIERTARDLDVLADSSSLAQHRSVAVDDWQLLPVLTEELTWYQTIQHENTSVLALCTYMYVPDKSELEELNLGTALTEFDTDSWQRLHVMIQLQGSVEQAGCAYRILVRNVNDEDKFTDNFDDRIRDIGCTLRFEEAGTGLCHIAIPAGLKNSKSKMGLSALVLGEEERCEHVNTLSFQALLTPYMQMYECEGDYFWSEKQKECVPCQTTLSPITCENGYYLRGCHALMNFSDNINLCEPCNETRPNNNGTYLWLPEGCAWECHEGYFYNASINQCQACTEMLKYECRKEAAMQWQACSRWENEQCISCQDGDLKRNEEFIASEFKDCDRMCKDGFYRSFPDLLCRECLHTVEEVASTLPTAQSSIHRFIPCTKFTNAAVEECY